MVERLAHFKEIPLKVPEGLSFKARLGSTRFRRRFWKALVKSRAKVKEVPEKVVEQVPDSLRPNPARL